MLLTLPLAGSGIRVPTDTLSSDKRPMLDRRQLLILGGTAALTANLSRRPPIPARSLKKSLMWGMIEPGKTILEKLQLAKAAGFQGVELDSPTTAYTPDEALDALNKTNMQVADIVDSLHWSKPLSDPDAATREAGRTALETALRDAHHYNTDSVLLVPAIVNSKVTYTEAWERSTAEIKKVLPLAAELKVHIAIENVWNNFLLSPMEAARYVDQFESPWVGWHMDLGNIVLYGWPEQWITTLGKRIQRLHIKDYSRKKLDEQGRWKGFDVELGQGDVNWPAAMSALDKIGYTGWASAEVAGGDAARLRTVSEQMDSLFAR